jgi:hypothetical protein
MSADIAPDINCPHCGPVIVCPHKPWTTDVIGNLLREDDWSDYIDKARAGRSFLQRIEDRYRTPRPTARTQPAAIAQAGKNPAYVAAAIRGELDRLAAADQGCRNHTLNQVAFAVFGFVKGGHADEAAAHAELVRIAEEIGLGTREIHATLRSAWTSASPRDVPSQVVEI